MSVSLVGLVGLDVTPDPSIVQPGILPLLITIGLAVVIFFLYRSMKKQITRIKDLPSEKDTRSDTSPREVDIKHPLP